LLDTFGDEAEFGKRIGGDIIEGKKTYLLIKAMENATLEDAEILKQTINSTTNNESKRIETIKTIYIKSKAKEAAEAKIASYFKIAGEYLQKLQLPERKLTTILELEASLKRRIN
jgi:geranylgeranyl diphosphate synthase type II